MRTVAESGLNWNIVDRECSWQTAHSDRAWEDDLCNRLGELRAKYGITSPILRKICEAADQRVLEEGIKLHLRRGVNSVKGIARETDEPEAVIRKSIAKLVGRGVVSADRSKKPHKFMMRD